MVNIELQKLRPELGSFLCVLGTQVVFVSSYFAFTWTELYSLDYYIWINIILFVSICAGLLYQMTAAMIGIFLETNTVAESLDKDSAEKFDDAGIAYDTIVLSTIIYMFLAFLCYLSLIPEKPFDHPIASILITVVISCFAALVLAVTISYTVKSQKPKRLVSNEKKEPSK